jgi:glycerol uptake facilitator-like aquaporin
MLATTWAAFGVGEQFEFPSHPSHYFIYWVGPCLAAILASTAYVIYAGGTVFGITLPIVLLKKKVTAAKKKN